MEIIEMNVADKRWTDARKFLDCPLCGIRLVDDPRWTEKTTSNKVIAHCPHCDGYVFDGRKISQETALSMIGEDSK